MVGEVENSEIRDLRYVLGTDGEGLFGRESVDVLKTGIQLSAMGRKWGFAGDSITNGTGAADTVYAMPYQSCIVAGMAHNYPATLAGVPGDRSDQVLARLDDIIATGIDALVVLAGTNDSGSGVTVESYAATMTAIVLRARRAGLACIVCTLPPIGAGADSGGHRRLMEAYNIWIRMFAPRLGAKVADIHGALVDPATGYYQPAYDSDGIHPSSLGHFAIAEVLGSVMASFRPVLSMVDAPGPGDCACIANPLMAGSPGDGNMPSGWYQQPPYPIGSGALAYGLRPRSGSLVSGQWFEVVADASAADVTTIFGLPLAPGSYAAGDRLALTCRREIEDVAGNWRLKMGGSQLGGVSVNLNDDGSNISPVWSDSAAPVLPPTWSTYTAPETGLTIWFTVSARDGQKFKCRIGELQVYNLSRMGLDGLIAA